VAGWCWGVSLSLTLVFFLDSGQAAMPGFIGESAWLTVHSGLALGMLFEVLSWRAGASK